MGSFYFFGYDSKLLELGINGQVILFQDICQPTGTIATFVGAVAISAESVSTEAAVGAVTASAGIAIGIFG